jgi:rare lipoprotein A
LAKVETREIREARLAKGTTFAVLMLWLMEKTSRTNGFEEPRAVYSLNVMCGCDRAHQVKGENMKNSLPIGLLALSLISTAFPVDASQKHVNEKHVEQVKHNAKMKHKIALFKKHRKHKHRNPLASGDSMNGYASWYGYESGPRYRRRPKTANGEYFSPKELTAAHKTLPFGTVVEVTNDVNHKSVLVRINDRGPFLKGRIIDLSKEAAKRIGITGVQKVSLTVKGFYTKYKTKLITT